MQWLLHWVNQPCNRSPNQSSPKTFFKQKKSSFTFPNNQILKRKHILRPSERTNYLIDPKNEISTKKILILTQIFYSLRKHFLYFPEKKFPMLCQKKNISNEINYQNENDHGNYNKAFFFILQYFFLYSTSLCFSSSESFLDCSWPYCPFFSFSSFVIIWCFKEPFLLSFFVISRILLINPLTFLYM